MADPTESLNALPLIPVSQNDEGYRYDYQDTRIVRFVPTSLAVVTIVQPEPDQDRSSSLNIEDERLPSMNVVVGPPDLAERSDDLI